MSPNDGFIVPIDGDCDGAVGIAVVGAGVSGAGSTVSRPSCTSEQNNNNVASVENSVTLKSTLAFVPMQQSLSGP